nr:uncharacterized protein si:dkey-163f14.6 [Misgurnus anguillicaudatus]
MLAWRGVLLFIFLIQLWTLTPGFADKGCSGFRHLENGRTFFRYGGLYVTFTCNPGFRIHGHRTSSCVSGQWARNPPLCVAPGCSSPGDLLHGSTVVSHDGSLAFFRCNAGFNLFGSALLYCKGKIWNGTKPICKVADIMSVHLMQESLHEGPEAPVSLKLHLHSHLNTPAVTASKDAFLKSALLGVPHIKVSFTGDKQESIKKTLEKKPSKKPWSDTTLTGEKVRVDILKEPISNLENAMDPIRNVNLSKSPLVESPNVTTISFSYLASTFDKSSSLNSATMPTGFTTPLMDTQELTTTLTDAPYKENEKDLRSTFGTDKPSQKPSVISSVETLPTNSYWTASAPNINTLGTNVSPTDTIQSSHEATTEGSVTPSSLGFMVSKHVSSTHYLMSTAQSTVSSSCGGLCDQRPELRGTSSPLRSSARTSPSPEVLTVTTQLVSKLPLKVDTTVDSVNHTEIFKKTLSTFPTKPNLLSQFLRNITSLTSIVYQQGNKKSNHSDPKQLMLDSPSWKDFEIPRFPTRKLRPVCPYPPLPSHGTFYFRSIRNPTAFQYKHYIQYACYPGYTLTNGDVYSYCQRNGQWSGKTPLCLALSPCSLNNGGCSQICQEDGQNRAQCLCKPGFLLLEDQRTCRDLDECVEQLHLCQQVCENTLGSYRCSCNPGFQLSTDRTSCTNINECEEMQEEKLHRCEWKCVNLPGAHRCICPRGYRLHLNGYQCEDINECELNNGGCSHHCINNRGSYKCTCPEMHRIYPYNQKRCQPVQTQTSSLQ